MDTIAKLLEIIPEEETNLREVIQEMEESEETEDLKAVVMAFIGWPTDQWQWDALSVITGKPYEVLQPEMEPYD